MGVETIVLGYIAEPWVARYGARNRLFRRSNRRVLAGPPDLDEWPPLSRGVFASTEIDPLRVGNRAGSASFCLRR